MTYFFRWEDLPLMIAVALGCWIALREGGKRNTFRESQSRGSSLLEEGRRKSMLSASGNPWAGRWAAAGLSFLFRFSPAVWEEVAPGLPLRRP